jgi:hypothetical protein
VGDFYAPAAVPRHRSFPEEMPGVRNRPFTMFDFSRQGLWRDRAPAWKVEINGSEVGLEITFLCLTGIL